MLKTITFKNILIKKAYKFYIKVYTLIYWKVNFKMIRSLFTLHNFEGILNSFITYWLGNALKKI